MKTVVGIFETVDAEGAINKLYVRGFNADEVTVIDQDRVVRGPAQDKTASPVVLPATGTSNAPVVAPIPVVVTKGGWDAAQVSVKNTLHDLGVSDEATRFYTDAIKNGGTVIVVRTADEKVDTAETTMRQAMASNVSQPK